MTPAPQKNPNILIGVKGNDEKRCDSERSADKHEGGNFLLSDSLEKIQTRSMDWLPAMARESGTGIQAGYHQGLKSGVTRVERAQEVPKSRRIGGDRVRAVVAKQDKDDPSASAGTARVISFDPTITFGSNSTQSKDLTRYQAIGRFPSMAGFLVENNRRILDVSDKGPRPRVRHGLTSRTATAHEEADAKRKTHPNPNATTDAGGVSVRERDRRLGRLLCDDGGARKGGRCICMLMRCTHPCFSGTVASGDADDGWRGVREWGGAWGGIGVVE
ncbi:hypothetical protein B0H17DRAFT_1130179 [Mycena rosella]|uniref:Uncharacterized protein n=1 Tax=Mycena rosella TaxID=1033263 RepID=A0AAD7GPJ3_MYCRO|nr:hypothetical protein B0H17DRAFT_1130179 [Mycena rosella]